MTIQRMDHVGVVVDDLEAAVAFFVALGLELDGEMSGGGPLVDRIVALELIRFNSPPAEDGDPGAPANARGLRHVTFAVDDIDAALADLEPHGGQVG